MHVVMKTALFTLDMKCVLCDDIRQYKYKNEKSKEN